MNRYNTPAMKTREYYLLLALVGGARHGLAMAREVERLSDQEIKLWPATLYGTLDALNDQGWITESVQTPADESERKRFYSLTRAGRQALAAETERLAGVVRIARGRLKRAGEAS
jgi:DNA-binding PadR family transcriptional regulator